MLKFGSKVVSFDNLIYVCGGIQKLTRQLILKKISHEKVSLTPIVEFMY